MEYIRHGFCILVVGYKRSIGMLDCLFSFMHDLFIYHSRFSFHFKSATPLVVR